MPARTAVTKLTGMQPEEMFVDKGYGGELASSGKRPGLYLGQKTEWHAERFTAPTLGHRTSDWWSLKQNHLMKEAICEAKRTTASTRLLVGLRL